MTKCPRCAAEVTRRQIAMATYPFWLSCRSCGAPLVGDKTVKLQSALLGILLVLVLVASVVAAYVSEQYRGLSPVFPLGMMLWFAAWALTVFLTHRYGTYLEREPTNPWWTQDVLQWLRPRLHNVVAFAGCALLVLVLWAAIDDVLKEERPLWAVLVASPFFDALLGFATYFAFRGHPFVRIPLVAAVATAAALMYHLILGSPRLENPSQALEYAVLGALIFAIGAAFATIVGWALTRKTARPAI